MSYFASDLTRDLTRVIARATRYGSTTVYTDLGTIATAINEPTTAATDRTEAQPPAALDQAIVSNVWHYRKACALVNKCWSSGETKANVLNAIAGLLPPS